MALFPWRSDAVAPLVEASDESTATSRTRSLDLDDVIGQSEAKWAAEVAAAGRHHMLFHGPPGVGKTMIAQRVPGLLPDLTVPETLEVSAIHSLAGFALSDGLITRPPFSDPHRGPFLVPIEGFFLLHLFWSLTHTRVVISDWKTEYNHHRRHSSLGYQAPARYAEAYTHH